MLPILGQITNARFFTLANNFTSAKLNWMNRANRVANDKNNTYPLGYYMWNDEEEDR